MPAVAAKPKPARVPKPIVVPDPDRSGPFTYDDFCYIVAAKQKADLIDGVVHMTPPDSIGASRLEGWLRWIITGYVDRHELGEVFGSRVALRLDDKNGPEPDILVVLKEHAGRLKKGHVLGPCDLAIEIVSPESVERDYNKKRALYERVGVSEYWIIDEDVKRVTHLRLGPKGYVGVRHRKGVMASKVLTGFWLRPEWLWQSPRRPKSDVLTEILAGVPS
jgi:Uma2 family endonuclease